MWRFSYVIFLCHEMIKFYLKEEKNMYAYVKYPRHSKGGYNSFEPDEEPENLKFHIDLVSNDRLESTDLYINELVEVIEKVEKNIIIKLPQYLSKFIDPIKKEWTGIEKSTEVDDDEYYITYYYIDKEENHEKDSLSTYESLYRWKLKEEKGKLHFIKCYMGYTSRFFDVVCENAYDNEYFYAELNSGILDYAFPTTKKAARELYDKFLQDPNNNMDLFLNTERKHMSVFLSHSMSGLSEKKVDQIRKNAMKKVEEIYKDSGITIEFIDNFHHEDAPLNAGRLWHLGRSIQQMEDADAIYFCENHMFGKGCVIERMIAELYHLKILNK